MSGSGGGTQEDGPRLMTIAGRGYALCADTRMLLASVLPAGHMTMGGVACLAPHRARAGVT